jgi:hypothetical protein
MNARSLIVAAALGGLIGFQPLRGDAGGAKVDIPFGYLMPDTSCPGATHVLLHPCPPNSPQVYVVFQQGKDVDRFLGRNVTIRGMIDPKATCSAPLVRATKIAESLIVPDCPAPPCQPGDPPPCP